MVDMFDISGTTIASFMNLNIREKEVLFYKGLYVVHFGSEPLGFKLNSLIGIETIIFIFGGDANLNYSSKKIADQRQLLQGEKFISCYPNS